ncbi:MAG: hypothetical protein E7618_02700 [Ruminococcaceae bacterium]|nr:hypothetical protein [Oscillospiraceae bacterium]
MTPLTPELKVKEQLLYKSIYCGLCHCMGQRVCTESRMTLSYDVVFLVLIRLRLTGEPVTFGSSRCMASPFRKKPTMKRNPTLEYCAAAGSLLAYHNLEDNAKDHKGIRGLASRLLFGMAGRLKRKAALPDLDAVLVTKLKALAEEEASDEVTVDSAGTLFGELLAEVFAYGLEGAKQRIAAEIGFHVGKWIYLLDAADDYDKDSRRGEFNPLREFDRESLRCALTLELEAASRAMSLIEAGDADLTHLTENIIYLGMPHRMAKILSPDTDMASDT